MFSFIFCLHAGFPLRIKPCEQIQTSQVLDRFDAEIEPSLKDTATDEPNIFCLIRWFDMPHNATVIASGDTQETIFENS